MKSGSVNVVFRVTDIFVMIENRNTIIPEMIFITITIATKIDCV